MVLCWSPHTNHFVINSYLLQTPKPIQDILTVNGKTLVVFTDGSCSSLESIINNGSNHGSYTWTGPVPTGSTIVNVSTASGESETFLTVLVEDAQNGPRLFYYKVTSDEEEEEMISTPHVGVVHLKRDNAKMLKLCVVQCNSGLAVLSICKWCNV